MSNRKMRLRACATRTDPDTGKTVEGTIGTEYDFDQEKPIGYNLIKLE